MGIYYDDERVRENKMFTFYFVTMFCLYTYTYIQLAIQLFVIAYVIFPIFKSKKISVKRLRDMKFYLLWFGTFTFLLFISRYWAYDTYSGSKTMITVFRIFIIGCTIYYYIDSQKKTLSILQNFQFR